MYSTNTSMAMHPGPLRTSPDTPVGDRQTPAQILADWLSRLERTPYGASGNVEAVLNAISQGDGLRCAPLAVESAFNTLIRHEEYGVFVAAFNAWCECCQTDGKPFNPSLNLRLPHDWKPARPAEMVDAFRQIQVAQVRVTPDSDASPFHPIPEALCLCVVALLEAGTRALKISGELAAPRLVANAFRHSQLRLISLGQTARQHEALGTSEMASYATLVEGLMGCGTLECLEIRHNDLLALPGLKALSNALQGPPLQPAATTTTTTTSAGTTVTQAQQSAANASTAMESAGPNNVRTGLVYFKTASGRVFEIPCTEKDKVKDFVDAFRKEQNISDDLKIMLVAGGRQLYVDYGTHQHPAEDATVNSVEHMIELSRLPDKQIIALVVWPIADQGLSAPRADRPAAIDYKSPSPDRPISFDFYTPDKPLRLYFEGNEAAKEIADLLHRELKVKPRNSILLASNGVFIYLDLYLFGMKKREYERSSDSQGEARLRYAADGNALLRITRELGSGASVQVMVMEH